MKVIRIILVAVAFMLATNTVSAQLFGNRDVQEVVFSVNIDCHSCEQKVRRNIPLRGVTDIATNLEKQTVTIKFNPNRTNKENLQKAIERLGFTCKEVRVDERGNVI